MGRCASRLPGIRTPPASLSLSLAWNPSLLAVLQLSTHPCPKGCCLTCACGPSSAPASLACSLAAMASSVLSQPSRHLLQAGDPSCHLDVTKQQNTSPVEALGILWPPPHSSGPKFLQAAQDRRPSRQSSELAMAGVTLPVPRAVDRRGRGSRMKRWSVSVPHTAGRPPEPGWCQGTQLPGPQQGLPGISPRQ